MGYTPPPIEQLSAHDYNKIRTSFDAFTKTQGSYSDSDLYDPNWRGGKTAHSMRARNAAAEREDFKKGNYGIEDEYRYLLANGFKPTGYTPAPAQPVEEVQRNTGPVDPPGRIDVGQQPQQQQSSFDPMAMMMLPLLLEALKPKPIPKAPDPVVYGSAGQVSQSTPGVKINQSQAARSRSTQGTTGMFNRNNLRISNLNFE